MKTKILKRIAVLVVAFAVVWLALIVRVPAPGERFHYCLAVLWCIDIVFYAIPKRRNRGAFVILAIALVGMLAVMSVASNVQFANSGGFGVQYAAPGEILFRFVLLAGILLLFRIVYLLLTSVLNLAPATRALLVSPRGWPLGALRTLLALAILFPYIFVVFNVHRAKVQCDVTPLSEFHLPFRSLQLRSSDGLNLAAWLIPGSDKGKAVVVCHGLSANKEMFIGVVPFLHRAGYTVLMFDFRGHGGSDGHTITFGPHESRDVRAAFDYLAGHGYTNIVGYGFSMGGSALLYAVPGLPHLSGVVLDSSFADFGPLVYSVSARLPLGVGPSIVGLAELYGRFEIGIDAATIKPVRFIGDISPRPVLIIHGLADSLIPPSQARENFAAARPPRQLWLVPKAGHCLPRLVNIPVYEKRVTTFLRTCR